ncbi:hypothetical protein [Streptomyces aureoverticillatus]|uniref:hypothetical protein n=1 Tax=Streptomyces aureoverticillatus TaxID=66871 RepID=UPI0013DC6C09|nr:hypothetical protein [Streptomyces aureoverticillatus]QIB42583.1 hypothetical protein G3H79_05320 [Streptomyces aureoverticillatus]
MLVPVAALELEPPVSVAEPVLVSAQTQTQTQTRAQVLPVPDPVLAQAPVAVRVSQVSVRLGEAS